MRHWSDTSRRIKKWFVCSVFGFRGERQQALTVVWHCQCVEIVSPSAKMYYSRFFGGIIHLYVVAVWAAYTFFSCKAESRLTLEFSNVDSQAPLCSTGRFFFVAKIWFCCQHNFPDKFRRENQTNLLRHATINVWWDFTCKKWPLPTPNHSRVSRSVASPKLQLER